MNERIERIKKRIEKEYVFDEEGDVVVSMQADLVWSIEQLIQLEDEKAKTQQQNERMRDWFAKRTGLGSNRLLSVYMNAIDTRLNEYETLKGENEALKKENLAVYKKIDKLDALLTGEQG